MILEGAKGTKNYALLLACEDSDYVKKMYGGYFYVFQEAFKEEGQHWDLYRVANGEFPNMETLDDYEGFVLSGSPHDAHGNQLWILKLCLLLQTLHSMKKKILGICFGHQLLCRALGGKTGRAGAGWDIGVRNVTIVDELPKYHYLHGVRIPKTLSILEIHQDELAEIFEVLVIPAGAEVIGYSDRTDVEVFTRGEHILGIQGHPEYTKDILFSLIDRLLNNNTIEETVAEEMKDKLDVEEPDRDVWLKICRNFLSRR